ncbi:histone-fold-containing protein [Ramaria rubella]|nr:histone-fold-containing protein [Ramaria rubella]
MPRPSQDAASDGIDNFQLPKALITRIAKSALSNDTKLQKDAVNSLLDGATVFINYLAATAQDVASSRSRKTIAGPDILKALEIIEFGDLVPMLQAELNVHRGIGKTEKGKSKAIDVKGKGKEKLTPTAPTDTPLPQSSDVLSAADAGSFKDAVPEGEEMPDNPEEPEDEGFDEDEEMIEADEDEELEDDDVEELQEFVDTVVVEEEELRKNQRGLEEGTPQPVVSQDLADL